MLKKRLGIEVVEKNNSARVNLKTYFKIPPTLIIPEGCERIGNWVFSECGVEKVVISGSVKSIGTGSFDFCTRLKEVKIPESVEFIGDCAFDGCENAVIIINKSSKSDFKALGRLAFRYSTVSYVKEKTRT